MPAAEEDRVVAVVAWLDKSARVEEDRAPVFGWAIAVEEHHMPRLFEVAVVASLEEALSNSLGLVGVRHSPLPRVPFHRRKAPPLAIFLAPRFSAPNSSFLSQERRLP